MDNFIDKQLDGRYQIKELIGAGGMANVYKALDLKENRLVAVKILREDCMGNEDLVRRFKNESKAISVLNHPNIVKVYDVSVSDKLQFIVMEYVDGITLKDYMEYRKEPLTYKETLHFITQTLLALQHAHQKGIVHRDIKPQNIMLLADGNIKVMDFGIARFSRSENQTMTDKAIGSVHYISPEQAKGDVTDLKADIYSVGVMMYEMLSGRLPFESDSAVSVAIKQISDTPTPIRTINSAVPEALAAITQKAMAKEPRERYQSAGEMLSDLEAFKRNPNVKFDYQYTADTSPTRYLDKVVNKTAQKRPTQPPARPRTPVNHPARKSMPSGTQSRKPVSRANAKSDMKHHYTLPILAGMAAAFAVGATLLVFLIFKMTPNSMFTKRIDVDLPSFVGMSMDEIKKNDAYMKGFTIKFEEIYKEDKEAGKVYDQTPKAPKKVKEGSNVVLRVSKGVEMVFVPDIAGMDKDAGIAKLKEVGLGTLIKPTFTNDTPIGKIIKTDSAAGVQVSSGTVIYVYVSQEEKDTKTTVPNCIDLPNKEAAQALLSKSNLAIGGVTEVTNSLPAGQIIGQNPVAGTPAIIGGLVYLEISSGHTHGYSMGQIITPATCTTKGTCLYVCSCGDSYPGEYAADLTNPAVHIGPFTAIDETNGNCICSACGTATVRTELIKVPVTPTPPPASSTPTPPAPPTPPASSAPTPAPAPTPTPTP
ncbi:MAG: Stk1 family PASTA domain-containing Ser/Thr kinase [Ruthenibacterium sp.]